MKRITLCIATLLCITQTSMPKVQAGTLRVIPLGDYIDNFSDNGQGKEYQDLEVALNTNHLTVSGYSSGAFMTNNMLVIFQNTLKGGAAVAGGGPCAQANLCKGQKYVRDYGTSGLEDMSIYIWGGSKDKLFGNEQPKKTADYYKQYTSNVVEEYTDCGHSYPSDLPVHDQHPQVSCERGGMTNSGDMLAEKTLSHIMQQEMQAINTRYNDVGQLYKFDMTPFFFDGHKMLDYGYVYIPTYCLTNICKTHIWFHGCGMTAGGTEKDGQLIGSTVMRKTGILELAASNQFIAIFPQAWEWGDYWNHCWAAANQQDIEHPQYHTLRKMLIGMFDRELLTDDVPLGAVPDSGNFEKGTTSSSNGGPQFFQSIAMVMILYISA